MVEIAVVTSIMGPVDALHTPVDQSIVCDYFAFTDQPYRSDKWRVVDPGPFLNQSEEREYLLSANNDMKAKWFKWQTHKINLLERYAWIIWIDGSIFVKCRDFVRDFIHAAENGVAFFKHTQRDCLYKEARYCYDIIKYKDLPLRKQIATYREQGMPEHYGLWANGIRANRNDPSLHAIFDQVWREVKFWGNKDQVPTPYVYWKNKFKPSTFDPSGGLYKSKYLEKMQHLPEHKSASERPY